MLLGTAVLATTAAAMLAGPPQALGDEKPPAHSPDRSGLTLASAARPATVSSPAPTPTMAPKTSPRTTAPKPVSTLAERAKRASRSSARVKLLAEPLPPGWVKPVDSYRLTAHYGEGGGLWSHGHTGQDFAASTGTPVKSVGAGVVVSTERAGAYGNRVIIRHADGTETWYCHLSAFGTSPGQSVKPGELIGLVGSTGNTTGPHLHLEVRPGGTDPIDPMPWLRAHGVLV